MSASLSRCSWGLTTGTLLVWVPICFYLALLVKSSSGLPRCSLNQDKPELRLSPAGTFNIVILADLHYGEEENGWGIDQDINSTRVLRAVLDHEAPDFVVINGDLITGENTFRENSTGYVDQIVAPLVEHNVSWASTYGNHDSKFNLSREALFAKEKTYALSYTTRMNADLPGITNYYLLLHKYTTSGTLQPAAILWFFDSRGGASYQHEPANEDDEPDWVPVETASWFAGMRQTLEARYGVLPSLVFVHIPPRVFLQAQDQGLDPSRFPGVNEDIPVAIQGGKGKDDDFLRALLATKGLHSIHVGHDHGNAWCSTWPSNRTAPFICFAKHSSYGGYGTWNRGARVVRMSFGLDPLDFEVETWVRMEDGSVVTRVSLNGTYGVDRYPTEDGE